MVKISKSIISVQSLHWETEQNTILKSINWVIEEGENWVLMGKNGSGKTSLINFIFGYKWPSSGSIEILGKAYGEHPIREIQNEIGILESSHQETRLQRGLTVKDILRTGLLNSIGLYSETTNSQEELIQEIIAKNSWIKSPNQNFDTLSSGEKKKILLLRALIRSPKILILDEPTANLDIHAREDFFKLLSDYHSKTHFTSILITHRVDEIPDFFTHAFLINTGETVFQGKLEEAFQEKYLSKTFDLDVEVHKKDKYYFFFPRRTL